MWFSLPGVFYINTFLHVTHSCLVHVNLARWKCIDGSWWLTPSGPIIHLCVHALLWENCVTAYNINLEGRKTRCVCCVSCVCVCRLTDWHTLSVSSWTLGLSGAPGSQELLLRSTLFWNAALSSTGSSTEVKEAGWSWRVDISAFFHV